MFSQTALCELKMEMNDMINGICNWMNGHTTLVGVATLVGGLHMVMTQNQPVLGMLDIPAIKGGMLLNSTTIGGSLVIVGVVTAVGGNILGDVLNRVLFSVPMVGDVTLLRVGGFITLLLGVAVLTGFDPLSIEAEV